MEYFWASFRELTFKTQFKLIIVKYKFFQNSMSIQGALPELKETTV